jgi:hypothetical protein
LGVESFWDTDERVAITRYFIVDAATGEVARHTENLQAYIDEQYRARLIECGFIGVEFLPSLIGGVDETLEEFFVIVAHKRGAGTNG